MDNPQSLLQSAIVAITQYTGHKIERNFEFLQKQIDVLISRTNRGQSLRFFNPSEVLPSECLACLVNLISDPGIKHTLLLKCLLLFNNLVGDSSIRESLHEKFQLTPALASVIRYHGSSNSDTLTAEALQLLQKVTYGHRISFEEGYMEDLVKFLLAQICSPSTGLTKPAMGVLVNLTRDNFSVQAFVKNYENMQEFSRKLTKLLGDQNQAVILFSLTLMVSLCLQEKIANKNWPQNQAVILFSLTLMVSLCLQEKIANKFFNTANAPRTLQMIFNLLIDGDAGETRRYAVDLLKDVLRVEHLQKSLASYEFLGSCLEQTLTLLTTSSPDSVIKIFELLRTLCQVSGIKRLLCRTMLATFPIQDVGAFQSLAQMPLSKLADPLLATVHWAGQSPDTHGAAPLGAWDLLTEIYEELVFSHDKVHHEKHAAALLPTIIHIFNSSLEGSNLVIQRKLLAMVKGVKLLRSLCNDETLLTIVSKKLNSAQVAHLMHHQFQHNMIMLRTKSSPPSDDWSGAGVDLVLYLLDVISILKNTEMEDLFFTTMQESNVVPFLACGMCSGNRQRVQDTIALVCLSSKLAGFPVILLGDTMAAMNADKETRLSHVPMNGPLPGRNFAVSGENKENFHHRGGSYKSCSVLGESSNIDGSKAMDVSTDSVMSIIEKMNSGMKLQPGDIKSPDIIAIYQSSLHSLQTKEQQLQDLLEAKTLALTQADRMLAQYRARKGQEEAESNRLRMMLLSAEKCNAEFEKENGEMRTRLDQYVHEIEELNEENQKLKQVAQMHQELTVAHKDMTDRYEALSKAHQTLTQEHRTLSEMHDVLQKHNTNLKQQYDTAMEQLSTLQEERKKVGAQLRKTEDKLEDTAKASLKWEYDYKRSEEERETMDMCIDKLRSDMGKVEQKKKQLLDQVHQLEFKREQNEQKMTGLEDEIRELKNEVSKHRQIAALINSLSSGETPDVSDQKSNTTATGGSNASKSGR